MDAGYKEKQHPPNAIGLWTQYMYVLRISLLI